MQNVRGGLARSPEAFCIEGMDDILLLTETWLLPDATPPFISGFSRSFIASRPGSITCSGRGGVAVYVRDGLEVDVEEWRARPGDGVLWLSMRYRGAVKPLLIGVVYIAPVGSGGCPSDVDAWYEKLESDVADARAIGTVLLAGDFNARVANKPDFLPPARCELDQRVEDDDHLAVSTLRQSKDTTVNARGGRHLSFCQVSGMRIGNGRVEGDIPASPTSLGHNGGSNSVIDLFHFCPTLMSSVMSIKVGGQLVLPSDHVSVRVQVAWEPVEVAVSPPEPEIVLPSPPSDLQCEFAIDPGKIGAFVTALRESKWAEKLTHILQTASVAMETKDEAGVEAMVLAFHKLVCEVCTEAGFKQLRKNQPGWIRRVQRSASRQRAVRMHRRQHRRAVRRSQFAIAAASRARLLAIAQRGRKERRAIGSRRLAALLVENPKEFYRHFREKPKPLPSNLTPAVLGQHFHQLLGGVAPELPVPPEAPGAVPTLEQMDGLPSDPFSTEEVMKAVHEVRNGGAVLGVLKPQLLKAAAEELVPVMTVLFNACAAVGKLPLLWSMSAITAVPKSGSNLTVCDGYRGIAVGTLPAKIYASILNNRLAGWSETNALRAEGQFGFRTGRGTCHAAFVVRTLIEQERARGSKLYVCFVDFKKAYDSVPRHLLWTKLERRGVTGWVLEAVKALYADVPMCVKTFEGLGGYFQSTLGVKQGCPLSPLLFGMYLDDLEGEMEATLAQGTPLDPPFLEDLPVCCLMYADDLAQTATSLSGLKKQMEDFFCSRIMQNAGALLSMQQRLM